MPTLDLHLDTPWKWTKREQSVATPNEMSKGGLDKAVYALYLTDALQSELGQDGTDKAINAQIRFIKSRDNGAGKSYLALEGGRMLHQNLDRLADLAQAGIRYLTLTHNYNNSFCDSATDHESVKGLTEFGCRVVRACNKLGVLVDVSHCSDKTAIAAINASVEPVIASHSGCRALVDHPRNLSDELIKAIASTGGLVGVPFVKKFIGPVWSNITEHIDHVAQLVGPEHIAIGSDLDGAVMCMGAETASSWKLNVEYGLAIRGYDDGAVEGIAGGNALKLFAKVKGDK
jgi:membrane dipeptidase